MSGGGPPSRGRGSRGRRKRFGDNGFEEQGGYMNAKKSKLEEQFSKDALKECLDAEVGIFRNVAIFVNGYTGEIMTNIVQGRPDNPHFISHKSDPHCLAFSLICKNLKIRGC